MSDAREPGQNRTPERRRILITGLAGALAGKLAARLEADDRVSYVGGIDLVEPQHALTRTEFIRADLRNPLVAKVIDSTRVDTIVHLAIASGPRAVGGRTRMKELNVIGTMQLVGAAQKAPLLRRLVMRSTTAVYGSHYSQPALFREDSQPRTPPRSGYGKDIVEVEGYARAFGRRRPDVDLTILRFANFIGPTVETPLTTYLALPVVPTVLGYDARLQLCHEDDAVEILYRSALEAHPGIFNVAGPGVVYLSQAVLLAGKPSLPVPVPFVGAIASAVRQLAGVDFSPDQLLFLQFGRVGDITRMRQTFGYEPRYSTREALEDFLVTRGIRPLISRERVERAEQVVGDALVTLLGARR